MKKFLVVVLALVAIVLLASGMLAYVENNGWSYSIHRLPIIGHVLFKESGIYCTQSHCIEVITYKDSEENPDIDKYWDEPELCIWAHYMY